MSTAYFKVSRKTAAILTVLAMVLGLFPMAAFAAGPFTDVSGTLADQITKAADAGLVDGYGDGTFRPNENVSRAAFAKMIVLAVEKATGKELASGTENFSDVVPSQALYRYVVKAATAGWIDGYDDGTFRPDQPITRGQAAKIVQRALNLADAAEGFTDVPDNHQFAKAIGAVSAAGIITGYNSTTFKPNDNISRGQAAAVAYRAYDYQIQQAKYEVVAVTAVSPSALRVTFNKAVTDTSNVKFDVKRDGVTVNLTPSWASDKKSVDLKSTAKLATGTYTVTVSGLDFAAGKNSGTVKVEAEKVAKIELIGDKLIKVAKSGTGADKARISYRVYNQYGENITTTALGGNIQWAVSAGAVDSATNGVLTVQTSDGSAWQLDQKVVVTGVDPATGVSVSKTLTVAEAAVLSSFAFGNVIYPPDTDRIYVDQPQAAWIEVAATDENGNAVDATFIDDAVDLVVSNSNVLATFTTKDGKPVIALNTDNLTTPAKVTLTAVVLAKPELNKSITLDIVARPYPAEIDLGSFDGVVAEGDDAETLVLPLTVYDQFGQLMSAKDVAAAYANGLIQVADAGAVDLTLGVASEGDNLGKVVNTQPIPSGRTGYVTITVVAVNSGDTDSVQVQIRPRREPAELVLPSDAVTNLLTGATSTIKLGFKDQYGASYTPSGSETGFSYDVTVSGLNVAAVAVNNNNITDNGTVGDQKGNRTGTNLADLRNIQVTGNAEGTASIVVQLLKSSREISRVEFTVTVAKATSSLQYSIAEIPALYWNAAANGQTAGAGSAYAEAVKIIAKDSSKTYAVNTGRIVNYAVSPSASFGIGLDGNNQLKVWSKLTSRPDNGDVKGTVTVTFNTEDDKVLTLQAPVVISASEREVAAVHVRNQPLGGNVVTSFPSGSQAVSKVTVKVSGITAETGAALAAYLSVQDQFGRYYVPASGEYTIGLANQKNITVTADKITVGTNGQITVNLNGVSGVDAGDSFDVVILTNNGKTATFTVEVTN